MSLLNLKSCIEKFVNTTPVGKVDMYAGSTLPKDWLFCDGQAVSRTTYKALFNVIGTTYGSGNGSTTFNLPDFRDRAPVGAGSSYSLNSSGGTATETFTDAQLAHGHGFTNPTVDGGSHTHPTGLGSALVYKSGANDKNAGNTTGNWTTATNAGTTTIGYDGGHAHNVSGGSVSNLYGASSSRTTHDNRMPYRGINFIIYAGYTS